MAGALRSAAPAEIKAETYRVAAAPRAKQDGSLSLVPGRRFYVLYELRIAPAQAAGARRGGKKKPAAPPAETLRNALSDIQKRGFNLVKENGCFGCHEIAGSKSGRAIGPDLRLEPTPPLD